MELQPARHVGALTLPEFPREGLRAQAVNATVILRFDVGAEGEVTKVGESPNGSFSTGPFAADR